MKKESYPKWICDPCGRKHGKRTPLMATWHLGTCGVCAKKATPVTEPRDYGHLKDGWDELNGEWGKYKLAKGQA